MPDWSYQTLFRPALFRMPAATAREITLRAFGAIGRCPGGSWLIKTMGHMEYSPRLALKLGPLHVSYPVGCGAGLDMDGVAYRSLSQIGFGLIELGPVTVHPISGRRDVRLHPESESIVYTNLLANDGLDVLCARWSRHIRKRTASRGQRTSTGTHRLIRLRHMPGSSPIEAMREIEQLISRLQGIADGFVIEWYDDRWSKSEQWEYVRHLTDWLVDNKERWPCLAAIPLEAGAEIEDEMLDWLSSPVWNGFVTDAGCRTEIGYEIGIGVKETTRDIVDMLHRAFPDRVIIAGGGVHEPQDALDLRQAGADIVMLHSGLVYAGPGLPKRIHEAMLYEEVQNDPDELAQAPAPFWSGWGWMFGLGIGMLIGGILAWLVAATSVLLPYDEQFLGLTVLQLKRSFPELVAFMMHDRVTLAGTMMAIGVLYMMLSMFGMRYELHWAKTAVVASAAIGFGSFFLYLGYGYFDPLHALSAALLFPMFLFGMRAGGGRILVQKPNVRNSREWYWAQWGQLLLVSLGLAFAVGAIVITAVGITNVFVPQDLDYLCLSPQDLNAFNDRLIPLIAHDRAGFGGALFSLSIVFLAAALWGIREGERWMWRMILLAGLPGFVAAFGIHIAIGYTDFIHLLPAYIALMLYAAGLILLYPYLCRNDHDSSWKTNNPYAKSGRVTR